MISSFGDGSGQERDGTITRAGWRDFERIIANWLDGVGPENKEIFDVVVRDKDDDSYYGVSVKSKQLARAGALEDLNADGRVYMELSNSPAKFWGALEKENITENDFRKGDHEQRMGEVILETVKSWHSEGRAVYEKNTGKSLNLEKSVHLTISYSKPRKENPTRYFQLHSFDLDFPDEIKWHKFSAKCLRGFEPEFPNKPLLDWYGLSGGQLKYYPMASRCRYAGTPFALLTPPSISMNYKTARYWPAEWIKAGGAIDFKTSLLAGELMRISDLIPDGDAKERVKEATKILAPSATRG